MAVGTNLMTTEELLALPDDGVDRELIRGELREHPTTTRSGPHCLAMANLSRLLSICVRQQVRPRGRVYTSGVPVRIRRDPDTFVGADLVYLAPGQAARTSASATYLDEAPAIVIEILSPSDTAEGVAEKIGEYLAAGVGQVWVVNTFFKTVTVYRPDARPVLFNDEQELSAEPQMPGFRAPVAEVFED